jgi:capsular polysaccharide transport system ATP-binding protein
MIALTDIFKYYRSHGHTKIVLDHVSMDFRGGTSYGILGINGAGKSTLMRIMAGTEMPNGGTVRRSARISWPLGFAGGLHPKMTGKENVQFVARIYGHDARRVLDYVEDFAEIGGYIDVPVGKYSSGMLQRLAFGLSMAIEFEVYLIDEVTAVGDIRFQRRCHEEFERRRARADVIMVSHVIPTLTQYCERGIVLAHGRLHSFASVDDAIELYKKLNE